MSAEGINFDEATGREILRMLKDWKQGKFASHGNNASYNPLVAIEDPLIRITTNHEDGTYSAQEVMRKIDGTFEDVVNGRVWDGLNKLREYNGSETVKEESIYRIFLEISSDDSFQWYFAQGGGGSGYTYVLISTVQSISPGIYKGALIDNPIDKNSIENNIDIHAPNLTSGSVAGGSYWWARLVDDIYYIEPPVAL